MKDPTKNVVNRPLKGDEINCHLPLDKESSRIPWYQFSVIRMNSTYLECCDIHFRSRGFWTTFSLVALSIILFLLVGLPITIIQNWPDSTSTENIQGILACLGLWVIASPVIFIFGFMLKKDAFRMTHYPMRFNRKLRKVYFFNYDEPGQIVCGPWERIYFTHQPYGFGQRLIYGHLLSEDGKKVLSTFTLAHKGTLDDPGFFSQWEFIRRYMENGPQLLADQVEQVLKVSNRRENFWNGFHQLMLDAAGTNIAAIVVLSPLVFVNSIGRWIAMHTSKIPVWSQEIEAECQFEPNDPYIRDPDHLAPLGTVPHPSMN